MESSSHKRVGWDRLPRHPIARIVRQHVRHLRAPVPKRRMRYGIREIVAASGCRALRSRRRRGCSNHQRHYLRARRRHPGGRPAGCHRDCHLAQPAGRSLGHHVRERRLRHPTAPVRCLHNLFRAERLPEVHPNRDTRPDPGAADRRSDGSCRGRRNRRRLRRPCKRADPDDYARDQLRSALDRDVADQPGHQRSASHGSRRSSLRSKRRLLHLRRHIVRILVHGGRCHRERKHPWSAQQPVYRGCDPGDHRRYSGHLGRIRAFQRRRDQCRHQIWRQSVQRLLTRQPGERQLACADIVAWRCIYSE